VAWGAAVEVGGEGQGGRRLREGNLFFEKTSSIVDILSHLIIIHASSADKGNVKSYGGYGFLLILSSSLVNL
jgi:hypothetical protein